MVRTVIFSIAPVIAAAVLGYQVKQVGGRRETISVSDVSDWGGTYDKTTVDKIASVVATVDYRIDR